MDDYRSGRGNTRCTWNILWCLKIRKRERMGTYHGVTGANLKELSLATAGTMRARK